MCQHELDNNRDNFRCPLFPWFGHWHLLLFWSIGMDWLQLHHVSLNLQTLITVEHHWNICADQGLVILGVYVRSLFVLSSSLMSAFAEGAWILNFKEIELCQPILEYELLSLLCLFLCDPDGQTRFHCYRNKKRKEIFLKKL